MSKHSRTALTLLAVSAIGVGSLSALAQGAAPGSASPAIATQGEALVQKAQFRDRKGRGGRRGGAMMQMLQRADADNDGSVTQGEVDAFVAAQVSEADADNDGAIALDEFQAIYLEQTRPRMVDAFQALDEDGDGSVTTAELDSRFGSIVERFDRNDDGALSADDRRERGGRRGRGDR